ncbi:DNA/RNA non-specific endonuclease [Leyella stercorea]|uniref:DNA/RNA non-specific endonuclease n=1 Tax=Leyella stercorea TaxID=363265 RepID=UPI0026705F04|nr:DNA/RNA non-specific endonuclease [Leyella stercorea]
MKQYYKYALRYATVVVMMLSALTFTACGGDDDEGSGSQSSQVDKKNKNANIPSAANGYNKAIQRREFPALKKTGKQKVIVYRMASTSYDKDGVNFSVEWDCDKRSQRWTCYQMHKGYSGKYSRESNFFFDQTNLNSNEYWGEYTRFPGYDRGHICPSGDRTASKEMNAQTFVMTNMQPQYGEFNGYDKSGNNGLWLRMENQLRKWADKLSATDTIFVCKGGTIDSETNIITRIGGKLIVPKYFYMAILRKSSFGYAGMAFWSEQTNAWRTNETLRSHAISIKELEARTGIDFFCNLPDDVEAQVEKTFNPSVWSGL